MLNRHKWLKYLLYVLGVVITLFLGLFVYLYSVALVSNPNPKDVSVLQLQRTSLGQNCYVINNNWIRKSNTGLWEMYVEGDPFERGVINGKLAKELVYNQEIAFQNQISKLIPSTFYRNFLKYFIAWFNRDLEKNLTEEQKLEIYGVSTSTSPEFEYVGSGYQRLMNYHAAHDIGHTLQNLALVGCSSFATWNERSEDSLLIIGRNFDFYVGDKFAEDKIVEFCKPTKGYPFMMVTWGGMTGVLSGMNMEGITVTINAAKSTVPPGSATPISLLSREILQYSKNINEAIAIAKKRTTFVSESIMIGSANDNKTVVIEKTPENMDVYQSSSNSIICTNHFQSKLLGHEKANTLQVRESASMYRYNRMQELLQKNPKNTPELTAQLLRNQSGLKNIGIGYGNEKAVNQLIAHHSIIFEPHHKIVWVSTSPWQLGQYVAYDLNKVFAMKGLKFNHEICDSAKNIKADVFLQTKQYRDFVTFRNLKQQLMDGQEVDIKVLIASNPEYYHTYVLAGDDAFKEKKYSIAKKYYTTALSKEIATQNEKAYIKAQIQKCIDKQ